MGGKISWPRHCEMALNWNGHRPRSRVLVSPFSGHNSNHIKNARSSGRRKLPGELAAVLPSGFSLIPVLIRWVVVGFEHSPLTRTVCPWLSQSRLERDCGRPVMISNTSYWPVDDSRRTSRRKFTDAGKSSFVVIVQERKEEGID